MGLSKFQGNLVTFVICINNQPPPNCPLTSGMLVVVLRRKRVALRNANFIATNCAAVDAGVGSDSARREPGIKRFMLGLGQMLTVLVLSHGGPF